MLKQDKNVAEKPKTYVMLGIKWAKKTIYRCFYSINLLNTGNSNHTKRTDFVSAEKKMPS